MEGGGPREEADWASRLAEPVPTALQPRLGLDPLSAGEYIASSSRPSTKRHDMFTPGGHLYVDALFAATGLLASGSTTAVGASAGSAKANPALRRTRLCEINEGSERGHCLQTRSGRVDPGFPGVTAKRNTTEHLLVVSRQSEGSSSFCNSSSSYGTLPPHGNDSFRELGEAGRFLGIERSDAVAQWHSRACLFPPTIGSTVHGCQRRRC